LKWQAPAAAGFVGAFAYSTSAQSINDPNNYIAVNLTSEGWDTDGFHSNTTNNTRMTVPAGKAGYYLCIANTFWQNTGTNRTVTNFKKNNGSGEGMVSESNDANTLVQNATWIFNCAVGDYVELSVYSGNTKNLDYGYFQFTYLGA
jgi:hypothetical protein